MNFFKLYVGDYQRDTGSLSLAEHGAYLLMLQHYYATEKPLPKGKELFRMLRATTKQERDAILKISDLFWESTDAGLVNKRAVVEIEKGIHQRTVNQQLGLKGGRPRKTDSVSEKEPNIKPNRNPNQTPDTRELSNDNSTPKPPLTDAEFEMAWQLYPRRNGSNPKQQALVAWRARIKAGFSANQLLDGVARYSAWCASTRKTGTETVMQAKRFFGSGNEFLNLWETPSERQSNATHQRPDNSAPAKVARAIAERDAARQPTGTGHAGDDCIELRPSDYYAVAY